MSGSLQSGQPVRTQFKTPEGRYKLSHEKSYPAGVLHYANVRSVCKGTLAHLKDRPAPTPSSGNGNSSGSSSRFPSRLLGGGNGGKGLGFGSNGYGRSGNKQNASGTLASPGPSPGPGTASVEGEGTYLIFNVADSLYIADYSTQDKDPVKIIHFSNSHPVCHAFDTDAKDGHDLLIGMHSGDVYTASLRPQLQDGGRKLVGATHYSRDVSSKDAITGACKAVAWVPRSDGLFLVAYGDGNVYVYDKNKDGGNGDVTFPPLKDPASFSVSRTRSNKSNPIARWHISQGAINDIAFSPEGHYLATVGRDGFLRVIDWEREQLVGGCKGYYGAVLCCAWSGDSKYVVVGGEDDLIQVFSMEDQAVVAWGEGHGSWVSGVAFDQFSHQGTATESNTETTAYRIGSVGQDTQLLLWDFSPEEVVVPLRRLNSGAGVSPSPHTPSNFSRPVLSLSSSFGASSAPSPRFNGGLETRQLGVLQPSLQRKEVPKLSPVMAHRVHSEYLSSLIFAKDSIATVCHEGQIKVWLRPGLSLEGEAATPSVSLPPPTSPCKTPVRPHPFPWEGELSSTSFGRGWVIVQSTWFMCKLKVLLANSSIVGRIRTLCLLTCLQCRTSVLLP